jgi:hypothetical protein
LAETNPAFYTDGKANPEVYELAGAPGIHIPDTLIKSALKTTLLVAAARAAELGESPSTIDLVAVEGIKIPDPPLKEIDSIGAAQVLGALEQVNAALSRAPLAAPRLLTAMAEEGQPFYRNGKVNPWLYSQTSR